MSSTVILLDSNFFWRRQPRELLRAKVKDGDIEVYIPMLVHVEMIRRLADAKGEQYAVESIRQFILDSGFELLPLEVAHAEAIADVWLMLKERGKTEQDWRAHRFDLVLCATAHATGYRLVTDDTGDHFRLLETVMNGPELEAWLQSL